MFDVLAHLPTNWIGPFLVRVSVCALIILIARRALAHRWGAQIPRLLWMILIIRCLVPWTQPIQYHPVGLLEFEGDQAANTAPNPSSKPFATYAEPDHSIQQRPVSQVSPGNGPVLQDSSANGPRIIVGLWILGVLAVLIATQYHNRRIISRAVAHAVPVPAWIQESLLSCRDQLGIHSCPALVISPHITSPCLAGAARPRILLPSTLLEDTTECEMRHILLHECIHLQQKDIWYAWLWTITLALHWFNPLLWWAGRRLSQDCEAACDERVLAVLDPDKRISYGQSLLALAQRLRPTAKLQPGFVCIIEHASRIERRLTMIKNYHKRRVPMTGKLALILFAVLVLTSYAGQQAKTPIDLEQAELMGRVEEVFLNKFKDVTMRKSLQWDLVKTNDHRHRLIRYKYEALFPGQERKIVNQVFVFDDKGNYLGHETQEPAAKGKMHPLVGNFVTARQDGGPTWQKASAIKHNTWFVGHFAGRRDERWYQLEVSADVTYAFFVDDEKGSGKYSADPAFEIYEQRVDKSTRGILDHRGGYYRLPLGYRPQSNCTAYIRLTSHNPGSTSFAFGYTEVPGEGKGPDYDILMGLASPLFEDGNSARFLF
jgi:beta-lactamase regulating signal transducer with metallopeptidase domain